MRLLVPVVLALAMCIADPLRLQAEDAIPVWYAISTRTVIAAAVQRFEQVAPGPAFTAKVGLTAEGIRAVAAGEVLWAAVVRDPSPSELAACPGLQAQPFCVDVLVMVAHHDNPVTDLSCSQIQRLYDGSITTWKDVGGLDQTPVLVARHEGFATMELFEERSGLRRVVEGEGMARTLRFKVGGPPVAMPDTNEKALAAVAGNPAAITFASWAMADAWRSKGSPVKVLNIDGVEPGIANVLSGKYAAKRNYSIITRGEPQGRIKDFIAFLRGSQGGKVIADQGYVPCDVMHPAP